MVINCPILFHQSILQNCFANTFTAEKLTIDIPQFSNETYLDYSALTKAESLKQIKIITFINNYNLFITFIKILCVAVNKTNDRPWIFKIKIPDRNDMNYLRFYEETGYNDHASLLERLTSIITAAGNCNNIFYTMKENNQIISSNMTSSHT